MILIVISNTRQVFNHINTSLLKDFGVAYARPLENKRCSYCTRRQYNKLPGFHRARGSVSSMEELWISHELWIGLVLDSNSFLFIIKQYPDDLLFDEDM